MDGDNRARATTERAVNPELLTKLLGAAVSTSGDYAEEGEETEIVAEPPVTQAQLEAVLAAYEHDPEYRAVEDPDYPLEQRPLE